MFQKISGDGHDTPQSSDQASNLYSQAAHQQVGTTNTITINTKPSHENNLVEPSSELRMEMLERVWTGYN